MFISFSHICISINFFSQKIVINAVARDFANFLHPSHDLRPHKQQQRPKIGQLQQALTLTWEQYVHKKSQFLRLRRKRRRVSLIFFWEWIFANRYFVFLRLESLSNVSTNRPFCVVRDDAVQIIESAFASQPVRGRGREVGRKTSSETEFAFR